MKLTNHQTEICYKVIQSIKNNESCCLNGRAGVGKAQPLSSEVITPNGIKKFGDLKVGNYVLNRNGKPTKILGIYPQGIKDNYLVTFSDGRKVECCNEHLWTISTEKLKWQSKEKTVSLKEIMTYDLKRTKANKIFVKNSDICYFNKQDLPLDPYVLGVLIGDGCLTGNSLKRLVVSNSEIDILNKISYILGNKGFIKSSVQNFSYTFLHSHKEKDIIDELGLNVLSFNKFIPKQYLLGDPFQRLYLLKGLMDTDGSIDKRSGRPSFCTTSIQLKEDFCFLCRSLGYIVTILEDNRNKYKSGHCFTIKIHTDDVIYSSEKHKERRRQKITASRKENKYVAIKSIEYIGVAEMQCIEVDAKDHLYLTNDFIPTHNTTCLRFILDSIKLKTICASPTHSAAAVFVEVTDRNCCTIASLLKKRKEINWLTGEVLFDPNITKTNKKFLIVIDESSMVGEQDYNTLLENFPECIFLFVGDAGQLPPVKEEGFSVFQKFPCYTLLINMRCGQDNNMFDLIEKVYNSSETEINKNFFNSISYGDNVHAIYPDQIDSSSLIITYFNEKRRYYNNWILENHWNNEISVNTKFVANENIGYSKKTSEYLFTNGEYFYADNVEKGMYEIPKQSISFEYFILKVKGKYINFVLDRTKIDKYLVFLSSHKLWKEYYSYMEIFPNIDLGWAISSHKSQGNTFDSIIVDVENILSVYEPKVRKSSLYVALSRASKALSIIV